MFWQEVHRQHRYDVPGISHIAYAFINELKKVSEQGNKVRLFESGAGNGRHVLYARDVLKANGELTATDISPDAIARLSGQQQIEALTRDMRDCPVNSGTVTHAISWRALHLLNEKERTEALGEKRRIIQSNGKFLLAVRSVMDFWNGLGEKIEKGTFVILDQRHMPDGLTYDRKLSPQSWHFYKADELRRNLEDTGFVVKEMDRLVELPGTLKHTNVINSYWVVKAERERRDLLWTGTSVSK